MKKDLQKLTKEELGKLFPVVISPPNHKWVELYHKEKNELLRILGTDIVLKTEHIGSTAIPNLAAKSTIDILVEVPEREDIKKDIITKMTAYGYYNMREVTDHIMFVKGYTPDGIKKKSYHIHMWPSGHKELCEKLYFRDYLISNPIIAKEYEELKIKLALMYKYDREAYTEGKSEFILRVTELAKKHKFGLVTSRQD